MALHDETQQALTDIRRFLEPLAKAATILAEVEKLSDEVEELEQKKSGLQHEVRNLEQVKIGLQHLVERGSADPDKA